MSLFTFNMGDPAMSKSKATTTPPAIEIETVAESPQRWIANRKSAPVSDILQGKATASEAARLA